MSRSHTCTHYARSAMQQVRAVAYVDARIYYVAKRGEARLEAAESPFASGFELETTWVCGSSKRGRKESGLTRRAVSPALAYPLAVTARSTSTQIPPRIIVSREPPRISSWRPIREPILTVAYISWLCARARRTFVSSLSVFAT